ncbi:MAG: SDR family oxidoreductase [Streptosporangiales bacterium]|nr:SDR family oxidoreductase [Streptosporangiales bacterium]
MISAIVGGTRGLGLEIARNCSKHGDEVVLTGRDRARAAEVAASLGGQARGVGLDLSDPHGIAGALAGIERVDQLVVAAIDRDTNSARAYDVDRAVELATVKLVGYTEVVHALLPAMHDDSAVVLFGGRAKDRPYPGSTTVSTVNGGVIGMVNTLAHELAPIRVNAIHPGIVGDSPFWAGKPAEVLEGYRTRTPTGRLASMADIVDAVDFLLRNRSVNAMQLYVDGGWLLT